MVFFLGLSPFDTKLELQKHSASLDNEEQASVFEVVMVCKKHIYSYSVSDFISTVSNTSY